jgi:hypothetical protein
MTERFFAMRFDKIFTSEDAALRELEKRAAADRGAPASSSGGSNFFHSAQAVALSEHKKLWQLGEANYLLARTRDGGYALFTGTPDNAYDSLEEAEGWLAQASTAGGEWAVFRY